jgi:hypothetical protein
MYIYICIYIYTYTHYTSRNLKVRSILGDVSLRMCMHASSYIKTYSHTLTIVHVCLFRIHISQQYAAIHTQYTGKSSCTCLTEIPTIIDPSATQKYPSATGSIIVGISVNLYAESARNFPRT